MEPDLNVQIDLYNLEEGKFEGSKYVLTSPRSLEACSRLNIKPVELLYKPLSEFQEELLPQDIPLRTIYAVFDESEQIRKQKLKLCREERSRIVTAETEAKVKLTYVPLSSLQNRDLEQKGGTAKNVAKQSSTIYKSSITGKHHQGSVDNESPKLHRELLSKKERNVALASQTIKTRPQSANGRKTQRCSSSAILGQKVRYRCGSAPNIPYKLPARDEKILKLMQERRESARKNLKVSEQAHRLWADQRKRDEFLKTIAENKRRELLAEENRINDMLKAEEQERRVRREEKERLIKKLDINDSHLRAESALMNQLRTRELLIADKIKKEAAIKEIQETNIKMKEKEDKEVQQLLLTKQICSHNSATERKELKIHHESLKKFLDNKQERLKFERRQNFLKSQQQENSDLIRSSMEQRLNQASSNLSQILEQRNQEILDQHKEELVKQRRARSASQKIEAEMEAWRYDLLQQEKLMEDRASEAVTRSIELRALQAHKNRIIKELEQKKNISRIHKDDEKYRRELERSLLEKDRKIENLKEYKERTVAQTRAIAQLSQTLRDDIKERYESDTFDKKVLEAQLYANLNREHRSRSPAVKNSSSSVKIC